MHPNKTRLFIICIIVHYIVVIYYIHNRILWLFFPVILKIGVEGGYDRYYLKKKNTTHYDIIFRL